MRNKPALLIQVRLFAAETVGCARIVTPRGICTVFLTRVKPSHFRIERITVVLPPFAVKLCIVFVSQDLGKLCKAPIKVSILQRLRHAHHRVSSLTIAETFGSVASIAVGLFHIVLTDTFQIGIRQYRYRRIANHTAAISIQKLPTVVIFMSTLLGQRHQRVDFIVHHARVDNSLERELATEYIPTAEYCTFGKAFTAMHLSISSRITSVYISYNTRIDHGVIEGRIEYCLFILASSFHFHSRKLTVPTCYSLFVHLVKVFLGNFAAVVAFRTVHINKRNTHLHRHFLACLRNKLRKEADVLAFHLTPAFGNDSFRHLHQIRYAHHITVSAAPSVGDVSTPKTVVPQRFTEHDIKVNGVVGLSPAVPPTTSFGCTLHPSADGMFIFYLYILSHRSTTYTPRQIYLYARLIMFRISEPKHTAMRSGCSFHFNIIVGQSHTVISNRSLFRRFIVSRAISLYGAVFTTGYDL